MKKDYVFRQSDLESGDKCLEHLRRKYQEPSEEVYSSHLARGNAVHDVIEYVGSAMMAHPDGEVPPWDDVSPILEHHIVKQLDAVENWVDSRESTEAAIRDNFDAFYWGVLPNLGTPNGVEEQFRVLLDEDKHRRIWLSGTMDWECDSGLILDWKNPTRPYQAWEKKRWDNQSTVYTYAVASKYDCWEPRDFQLVMFCKGETHTIDIRRGPADWEALKAKCWALVGLMDADLQAWPQGWNSWFCSPKWCPSWAECRGAHIGDNPW